MLTVYVHQLVGQSLQLACRGGAAIDPGAAAALGVDLTFQLQRFVFRAVETVGHQPFAHGFADGEFSHDFTTRGPFANHRRVGACTQHQLQCINQDGFSGPGFAGEHGKARRQIQIQRLHDDKIAQRHALPAQLTTPSFQCSLRRNVSK